MRRALTQLLPEDHQSIEKQSCKRRDSNERPSYQNVRVSFSSAAFLFGSLLQLPARHIAAPAGGLISFVTSFYGNGETKFLRQSFRTRLPTCSVFRQTAAVEAEIDCKMQSKF
jgi:hypothetical protein